MIEKQKINQFKNILTCKFENKEFLITEKHAMWI